MIIKVAAKIEDGCDGCVYDEPGVHCKYPGRPDCILNPIIYKRVECGTVIESPAVEEVTVQ